MLNPIFIRGQLTIELDGETAVYNHKELSIFGATGLPWPPFDPQRHFGRKAKVTIDIPLPDRPFVVQCPATLLRESTQRSDLMGLKFHLSDTQSVQLASAIIQNGFYPTEYVRKYPRIPANPKIKAFPLRVLASNAHEPIVFDVSNLSPSGILIHTQNQLSLTIQPGQKLYLTLEPRGNLLSKVEVEGLVCRILDDIDSDSGNPTRHIGIHFLSVDSLNKASFLALLQDILEELKT